ncbi:Lrp/AsnC family transcriptional regulator [Streptomyces sp900105755]|uniref:Lrp/AsnC family transcriptional regulator n=1 Tax=Streptomyces sp. 900105755 TaxID=3154389 RepID=UPI003325DB83
MLPALHAPVPADAPRSAEIDEHLLAVIRDAPPDATTSAIARAMGLSPSRLSKMLVRRRARLGLRNGTPKQILRHIRANLDAVALGFTGRDVAALDPGASSAPVFSERDEQLIGSILTHPRADLTALARLYGHPTVSLRYWANGLGTKLGVAGAAAEVVVHVRQNSDSVLRRSGLDAGALPELPPGATAELTERDKQLIGSILGHPGMTLNVLARHHRCPGSTMTRWAEDLARRLGVKAKGAELVGYVRRNGDDILERAGLTPDDLPRLP